MVLACKSSHSAIALRLLQAGADMNYICKPHGDTALVWCCNNGLVDVARQMLRGVPPADVDTPDEFGWTPLMIACNKDSPELCQALLLAGANVNRANKNGDRALTW